MKEPGAQQQGGQQGFLPLPRFLWALCVRCLWRDPASTPSWGTEGGVRAPVGSGTRASPVDCLSVGAAAEGVGATALPAHYGQQDAGTPAPNVSSWRGPWCLHDGRGFAEGFCRPQVLELRGPGCHLKPVESVGPEVTPSEILKSNWGHHEVGKFIASSRSEYWATIITREGKCVLVL